MSQVISPTDQTLRSLSGRSYDLQAGVPLLINPEALAEALGLGCTEVEEAPAEAPAPVAADPVAADPVAADPVAADPVAADPVAADPAAADPVAADPVAP